MKVLVATSDTQGARENDFSFCIEGELVTVGVQHRQARIEILDENERRPVFRGDESRDVLQRIVDVDRTPAWCAARSEHPVRQRDEAVGFAQDDFDVLVLLGLIELPREQLCRAAETAERIPDLVRELPGEAARRIELGVQNELATEAQSRLGVA